VSYSQRVGGKQVANICISSPFPRLGNYPKVTNVCELYQAWECDFTGQAA